MPKPRPVDEVDSYAHQVGTFVHVILHLPGARGTSRAELVLKRARRRKIFPAECEPGENGLRLRATVPRQELGNTVWDLAVRLDGADRGRPLHARLVADRRLPLALVVGPRPATRMEPPTAVRSRSRLQGSLGRARRRLLSAARAARPSRAST